MPISKAEKQDVVSTVAIEMERMFAVLSERFPLDLREQALFLQKIEDAFKSSLVYIDLSTKGVSAAK